MRVAWLGPTPTLTGGVPYMATQLLSALAGAGIDVDAYLGAEINAIPPSILGAANLSVVARPSGWAYDRWYSRTDATKYVSGLAYRSFARHRLVEELVRRHRKHPYDLVYQFSGMELGGLANRRSPPIILHPEVHAAGELRWHRRESALARGGEALSHHYAARAMLRARTHVQRSDINKAAGIISPSRRFGTLLREDYGVDPSRIAVVPNPIDLDRFEPLPGRRSGEPVRMLFVARMSVRKGVDQFVSLSHRLRDLAGRVHLVAIGDHALWSDYRHLLADLNPDVAEYVGPMPAMDLREALRSADALIQPSLYEPFALTVGEGLACGTPVVASDEVGAAEQLSAACAELFPAGDVDALEAAVRRMIERLRSDSGSAMRFAARAEAERLFAVSAIGRQLREALEGFARAPR